MGLYQKLKSRKLAGEKPNLDSLTSAELKKMFIEELKSDSLIADLFDVKKSKITYLRRKHGITIRNSIVEKFLDSDSDMAQKFNEDMKKEILTSENISKISIALTHFAFRNGPIEDMHADMTKNITDKDMEILNKYMVNRIAYIFTLIKEENWTEFNYLIDQLAMMFGQHWDEAIPDDGGNSEAFKKFVKNIGDFL